jgi:hypothetical protein
MPAHPQQPFADGRHVLFDALLEALVATFMVLRLGFQPGYSFRLRWHLAPHDLGDLLSHVIDLIKHRLDCGIVGVLMQDCADRDERLLHLTRQVEQRLEPRAEFRE